MPGPGRSWWREVGIDGAIHDASGHRIEPHEVKRCRAVAAGGTSGARGRAPPSLQLPDGDAKCRPPHPGIDVAQRAPRRAAWANASAQASSATSRDPDQGSTDRRSRACVRT